MKTKISIILSLFLLSFTSCNNNDDDTVDNQIICTTVYVYGLYVTLIDSFDSSIITSDVEIKATGVDYEEILMPVEDSDFFRGAGERAGNYILTVTSSNYQTYTSNVITIDRDECHVIGQTIEIYLTPN